MREWIDNHVFQWIADRRFHIETAFVCVVYPLVAFAALIGLCAMIDFGYTSVACPRYWRAFDLKATVEWPWPGCVVEMPNGRKLPSRAAMLALGIQGGAKP